MTIVDCKYFGNAFVVGRKNIRVSRADAARMLGVSRHDYMRYENGKILIPENVLYRMMSYAFVGLCAHHAASYNKIKRMPNNH